MLPDAPPPGKPGAHANAPPSQATPGATGAPAPIDLDEVRRFAALAFDPADNVEIRSCPADRKVGARSRVLQAGDRDAIAQAALELDRNGDRHVYYTLNPTRLG